MWCWKCLPSKIEAVMYIGREQYGTIYWTNFYFALNSLPHPTTSTSTTTTKTSPYPKGLGLDPPRVPSGAAVLLAVGCCGCSCCSCCSCCCCCCCCRCCCCCCFWRCLWPCCCNGISFLALGLKWCCCQCISATGAGGVGTDVVQSRTSQAQERPTGLAEADK